MIRSLAAILILATALLAGCAATASGAAGAPVETTHVSMAKSYMFTPSTIRIAPGATVTWTNDDNFTHNVRITGAAEWTSQPIRPGESVSHVVSAPGEYAYECTFHPQNMKGRIIVA